MIVEGRLEEAVDDGRISSKSSAHARSRLPIDMMQGLTLRARTGTSRAELLEDAKSYVPLILG